MNLKEKRLQQEKDDFARMLEEARKRRRENPQLFSSPLRAIKALCRTCQGLEDKAPLDEIKTCRAEWCEVWTYRTGKNLNRKKKTETQKEVAQSRLKHIHG